MKRNQNAWVRKKGLIVVVLFGALVGCKSIITDYQGKTVTEPNRTALLEGGSHRGVWKTEDLSFQYSYLRKSDMLSLTGDLALNEEIYWNYKLVDYLYFRMNFLDADGKILESRLILNANTSYYDEPKKWSFQRDLDLPSNTAAVSFSYMGRIRTEGGSGRDRDGNGNGNGTALDLYRSPLG